MLVDQIVEWLKKTLVNTGLQGYVFGLSGGIDSAVLGGLIRKAVGDKHIALYLPCYSQKEELESVQEISRILSLNLKILELSPAIDALKTVLPEGSVVQEGNIKTRLRMISCYHYASILNYLVAGSSNKTEYLLGYFTKFGDAACDVAPLQSFLKREVKMLGEQLGLPPHIVEKTPTAGLWAGQTDEKELGLSYDILDKAVVGLEEGSTVVPFNAIQKVITLNQTSEHKRKPPLVFKPPGR